MTTDDIKSVQILIQSNDDEIIVGTTSDEILIRMIASYVKFVKVDRKRFTTNSQESPPPLGMG